MRNVILTLVSALALGAAIGALPAASSSLEAQTPPASPTQAVVVAAEAFLKTLTPELRGKVQFPFTPQANATLATFARSGGPPGGPGGRGDEGGRGDAGRKAAAQAARAVMRAARAAIPAVRAIRAAAAAPAAALPALSARSTAMPSGRTSRSATCPAQDSRLGDLSTEQRRRR